MLLANLKKTKANKVLGLDISTNAIGYCVFYNRRPIKWGKITLSGDDVFERLLDASNKIEAMGAEFDVSYVVIESAIMVNNVRTAVKMAYVFGAVLASLQKNGAKVIDVAPITWQSAIGNKVFTREEKAKVYEALPGKSKTWYNNHIRELRKQRTLDYFNRKWDMKLTDNDVGDACGIASYGYWKLTKR